VAAAGQPGQPPNDPSALAPVAAPASGRITGPGRFAGSPAFRHGARPFFRTTPPCRRGTLSSFGTAPASFADTAFPRLNHDRIDAGDAFVARND